MSHKPTSHVDSLPDVLRQNAVSKKIPGQYERFI